MSASSMRSLAEWPAMPHLTAMQGCRVLGGRNSISMAAAVYVKRRHAGDRGRGRKENIAALDSHWPCVPGPVALQDGAVLLVSQPHS